MTSIKLNIGQKMPKFWIVISANLKIGKFILVEATSTFEELSAN